MELYLKNIDTKDKSIVESFSTNNPKIKSVNFHYIGQEKDLDKFLQSTIIDYAKQKRLMVD